MISLLTLLIIMLLLVVIYILGALLAGAVSILSTVGVYVIAIAMIIYIIKRLLM